MRLSSVLFLLLVLVSGISLLAVWFYPSVQDFMASNVMWNGIRSFNDEFEAENLDSMDVLPETPEKIVLVTIPYINYSNEELLKMKQFIDVGNILLLMDDYGYGNNLLAFLGVDARFTNKPLLDPLFSYKNQRLPRITDFNPEVKASGVNVVMLNHATTLTNLKESEVIAWSSDASFLDVNDNGSPETDEPKGPFAVAADLQLGEGKLVLVADPSIVINSMSDRDDNRAFMKYLTHQEGVQLKIFVDRSHLTQTPLDVSKTRLLNAREVLASPYTLVGIVAMIFVAVSVYTLKKGENIG